MHVSTLEKKLKPLAKDGDLPGQAHAFFGQTGEV
jgi:hypothetical protein